MAVRLSPISVQQAIPEIERDIRRCLRAFATEPLDKIQAEIRRIGDMLSEISRSVQPRTNDTELLEDLESLQSDYRCLTTRAAIVAKKQLCSSPSITEILNKPQIDGPTFERLLAGLTQESANTRFFVQEPVVGRPKKHYKLATHEQIAAQGCPRGEEFLPAHNHTTTLANILMTGELGLSPQQTNAIIRKLIEVKADFSAVDYTTFPFLGNFSMQNNPLKSLIALGSKNSHYDETLKLLIRYIGSLPEAEKHKIFDHQDHYPLPMSTLTFLIRQGKEDIACEFLRCGAHVCETDLLMACDSFGSTSIERPTGIPCVEYILSALLQQNGSVSMKTIDGCLSALRQATPAVVHGEKERLRNGKWLEEWSQMQAENELRMTRIVRTALQSDFPSFKELCTLALHGDQQVHELLLQSYAEELVLQTELRGNLSDDYRSHGRVEQRIKYDYAKTHQGQAKLAQLTDLLEKSKKEEAKAPAVVRTVASTSGTLPLGKPVGIPRNGTMNCWAIALAQFARYIPSLYKMVQTDSRLKGFADFFTAYDAAQANGLTSLEEPNSQTLRDCMHKCRCVSSSAYSCEDAAHVLLGMMSEKYPRLPITVVPLMGKNINKTHSSFMSMHSIPVADIRLSLSELLTLSFSTDSMKQRLVKKPPELFLQINRWRGTALITDDVNIQRRLSLDPKLVESGEGSDYECDAFITFLGSSFSFGHYVIHIKVGGQWYYCNDNVVTPVSQDQVDKDIKKAYIIHYAAL